MHVEVIEDAGARRPAKVDPHVDALRLIHLGERHLAALREQHDLRELRWRERGEVADVPRSGTTIRWPLLYG